MLKIFKIGNESSDKKVTYLLYREMLINTWVFFETGTVRDAGLQDCRMQQILQV